MSAHQRGWLRWRMFPSPQKLRSARSTSPPVPGVPLSLFVPVATAAVDPTFKPQPCRAEPQPSERKSNPSPADGGSVVGAPRLERRDPPCVTRQGTSKTTRKLQRPPGSGSRLLSHGPRDHGPRDHGPHCPSSPSSAEWKWQNTSLLFPRVPSPFVPVL